MYSERKIRKWYQFQMRTMLLFVALCSVLSGSLAWKIDLARKQRVAVLAIEGNNSSTLQYQYELDAVDDSSLSGYKQVPRPRGPKWLRGCLGDDFFNAVVEVELGSRKDLIHLDKLPQLRILYLYAKDIDDNDLVCLESLGKLEELYLFPDNRITEKGLEYIGKLSNLRTLRLSGTEVTDRSLKHIAKLHKLESLQVANLRGKFVQNEFVPQQKGFGDEGLLHVGKLKNLMHLEIAGQSVTDQGMRHLSMLGNLKSIDMRYLKISDIGVSRLTCLKQLEKLDLAGTNITDNGVAYLKTFKNLEDLNLAGTNISDDAMSELKCLSNLEVLGLADTRVTDVGLSHLHEMKSLKRVYVYNTSITDLAITELQKILPGTNFEK